MKNTMVKTIKAYCRILIVSALIAMVLSVAPLNLPNVFLPTPKTAHAASNPIVLENQQMGSTGWQFDDFNKATNHEIEGYASLTSVNAGGQINFMVSLSSSAQYTMDIYRMGYYPQGTNPDGSACVGPCGGRLMLHVGPLSGVKQATCPLTTSGANLNMVECQWTVSYTLSVPSNWITGNYLVKLRRSDSGLENYMTFVVRNDGAQADIVYSMDVTTWQAYNYWAGSGNSDVGYDLYGKFNDVSQASLGTARAYAVSFDRPYMDQGSEDGAGNYMLWDYPMTRWMEAQGYNVTYVTDIDLESNASVFSGRHAFVNTGHDEYYSDNMRTRIQNGISAGVNMAFFSANNIYFRVLFHNSTSGQALRQIYCDKGAVPSTNTVHWRELSPPQPENAIVGVMQNGVANSRPYLVYDPTSWIYAGTGLVKYNGTVVTSGSGQNAISGLIGYEFDERAANDPSLSSFVSYEPAGLQQVGHSSVPASDNGVAAFSDATLYTAPSGATVFGAGTIQWAWGVDNGFNDGFCSCNTGFANSVSQKITANILNKFMNPPTPAPAVTLNPTSLTFSSQIVSTTSAAQPITLTNSGNAALTISSIALSGTNASDFAQTNNCPATLAANATCTINVTFTPSASGSRSASVTITDNAANSPQAVALSGTGAASAPAVTLNPTSLSFGNQALNTASAAKTVTLTNSGTSALTISSIASSGTNASDFAQTNNCPTGSNTLAANATCTISVTFTPSASGSRSASVTITDNAANSPQTVALSGTGTVSGPAATPSPTSLSFGNQTVNVTSAAQTVTITNNGTAALTISSIGINGTNASDFNQTNNCPAGSNTLAVNATCTISVTFKPTASGTRSATLVLTDNAADSPQNVALSGTGVTATIYFSDGFETGDFSQWTLPSSDSSGQRSVETTVVNSGTHAASFVNAANQYAYIYTAFAGGAQAQTYTRFYFRLASVTSGTQLAIARNANGGNVWEVDYNNNSHGLEIYFWNGSNTVFTVTSPSNAISANTWYSLEVQDNQATSGQGQVWLNGTSIGSVNNDLSMSSNYARLMLFSSATGTIYFDDVQVSNLYNGQIIPAPAASLNPTSLNFGNQNINATSSANTVTLTNTGGASLTISNIAISGTNASDFSQTNNCSAPLAVNASCTINVTITPSALGARSANITITDNATNSPQSVALSGNGVNPAPVVSLNPTSVSFGNQNINTTSSAKTVTLTNTGTLPLTISSIALTGTNTGDFAQTNNCPASLDVNTSCTVSITYAPTNNGNSSASVTFTDNAADSPENVALTGTGVTPAPAVTLNPTSLTFGNQNVNTTSGTQSVTLTNSGTASLTIGSIALSGTNASDFAQGNNCPATLAANASCTINVTFTPTANGSRSASVTITDNAADSPENLALSGTGITGQIYFSDGFESGDFSQWTLPSSDSSGQRSVETTVVNSGTHAAAFVNAANQYAYIYTAFAGGAQAQTYTRFYFRFTNLTGSTQVAMARNANGANVWEADYDNNRQGLDVYFWNGSNTIFTVSTTNNALSANTWYSIEIQDNQATSGHGQVWINGTSVGSVDNDLSMSSNYARLMLFSSAPGTVYYDDVQVSNIYNGPTGGVGQVPLPTTPASQPLVSTILAFSRREDGLTSI